MRRGTVEGGGGCRLDGALGNALGEALASARGAYVGASSRGTRSFIWLMYCELCNAWRSCIRSAALSSPSLPSWLMRRAGLRMRCSRASRAPFASPPPKVPSETPDTAPPLPDAPPPSDSALAF